jgi:hypothetical protein
LKYLVVYCDGGSNKCTGYHIKESLEAAIKFAEKVSDNGFVVKIYEDIPIEIYEPQNENK